MEQYNIALTIRSFNLNKKSLGLLPSNIHIIYTNKTGRRLTEKELCSAVHDVHGVIAGTEQFTRKVIESARRLRVISRVGVGTDSIDQNATKKAGIVIVNTPVAPVQAVAEHTLALILSVLKHIPRYDHAVRAGIQYGESGNLLSGRTVGIVGMGRIGHRVGTLLSALGCPVIYYDPFRTYPLEEPWVHVKKLEDLVKQADIITLHAPAQKDNKPILNGSLLGQCRRNVIIINTARGSLIDENGLIQALDNGTVYAAGLDVLPKEPYEGPLLDYPQIIITPHVASNTVESREQMETESLVNLISALEEHV